MHTIDLIINSEGTRVICKRLEPGVQLSDLLGRFQELQIKVGFDKEKLSDIISEIEEGGKPLFDIVVCEVPAVEVKVHCLDTILSPQETAGFLTKMKKVGELLLTGGGNAEGLEILYFCAHEIIISIHKTRQNVYGMDVLIDVAHDFVEVDEEAIEFEERQDDVYLSAKRDGYLIIDKRLNLSLHEPWVVNGEKTEMRYLLQPSLYGQENMVRRYFELSQSEVRSLDEKEISDLLAAGLSKIVMCRKRIEPIEGRDASIVIHFVSKRERQANEEGQVDHKEFSLYDMVKKGEIICEKLLMREGVSGVDVYGNPIPVESVADCDYIVGENIQIETQGESVLYKAAKDGIVEVNEKLVNVDTRLVIKGDVGVDTGNITFDHSIEINKDLKEGFTVVCKGDCVIGGNVENGAVIECAGNLVVRRGVFGSDTRISVEGNAQFGFIQESRIVVKGNILVDSFVYHAQVFSGNDIEVTGSKIKGDIKGSVIGGELNAFHNMILHSVGSPSTETLLSVGVNSILFRRIHEFRNAIVKLDKLIGQFRHFRGIDLMAPNASQKIIKLDASQKLLVKEALEKIRKAIDQKKALQAASDTIRNDVFYTGTQSESVPVDCTIFIKNHIMPDLYIRIGTVTTFHDFKDSNKIFLNVAEEIVARPGS